MMWKLSARTYLDTRDKCRAMDEAAFQAFRDKWTNRAVRGLSDGDLVTRSKWVGFVDALNDEILARANNPDSDDYEAIHRLLDYLYAEE